MNLEELVRQKRQLESTLEVYSDMKTHHTFKAVERQLKEIKLKIKDHYRQEHFKKLNAGGFTGA